MLKSGNGDPRQCAENLLRIVRGEVPYDRVRGIDGSIVDMPEDDARIELEQDAKWNIENYEPRIAVEEAEIDAEIAENGDFKLSVNVTETEEEE